jgi:hypothetical protein
MPVNRFEEHIIKQRKLLSERNLASQKLRKYLLAESVDFKGSPLSLLLSKDEIKLSKEFMGLMAKHKYINAKKLKLEAKKPYQILNKREMAHDLWINKRRTKLINKFIWKELWTGWGYPIGLITQTHNILPNGYNSSLVYLCSDLKLRCRRNAPVFNEGDSYACGEGTIPAKEIVKYEFRVGTFYIDGSDNIFKSRSLEDLFLNLAHQAYFK